MAKQAQKLEGVKFTTPVFRLSFPKLFKPEQYQGKGEAYFSLTMLFPKDQDLGEMKKAIIKAACEKHGADPKKWKKKVKLPWRNGDDKADFGGYEGNFYCSAKSKNKPVVINRAKERLGPEDEAEIYAGCYCRAVIVAKATETGGNEFVSLYLQGVQKVKDGDPFGGGVNVDEDFDDLPEDEDDADNYESDDDNDMGF